MVAQLMPLCSATLQNRVSFSELLVKNDPAVHTNPGDMLQTIPVNVPLGSNEKPSK